MRKSITLSLPILILLLSILAANVTSCKEGKQTASTGDSTGDVVDLKIGDDAPDFKLKNQNEKEVKLSDFRGKKVLLSFYPLAFTPF